MEWKWEIKDSRLLLKKGTEEYYPTAKEIFTVMQGNSFSKFPKVHLPKEEFPELRFSSIGVDLQIRISFNGRKIHISCHAEKRGKSITFDGAVNDIPESIIINNTWVYFTDSRDEILEILKKLKIDYLGEISLACYIALSKELADNPLIRVVDDARASLNSHPEALETAEGLVNLKATLYQYQKEGFQWLRFMTGEKCGCILADEMGLGKTLQVIALIVSRLKEVKTPAIVVAPVSLLENWRREFEKFTTGVRVLVHHGAKRTGFYKNFLDYDVVITSYGAAVSDFSILDMVDWNLFIIDEAQNIKNPDAVRTKCIKDIHRGIAIAITGTPFENHMSDLWSLMDFIVPGCLGTFSEFSALFTDDIDGAAKIEPILTPLMLRRKVADVAKDLPERVDIPQALELTDYETSLYEKERQNILAEYGGHASLPMIQKLRMLCTHPALLSDTLPGNPCLDSTKYQRLCEILEEISDIGEKVILFTSYNKMFSILQNDIPERFDMPVFAINGSTPVDNRQKIIDRFSNINGTALLVLNPRAAGTGLNITAANRVIHYNLEWNPALEDQASARAYRRGQEKTVFIYRLFYKDTVEDIINDRIEKKRYMSGTAVIGTDGTDTTPEDIMKALMITPKKNL